MDIPSTIPLPHRITLRAGDLLLVRATGGAVVAGDAVEGLGSFSAGALKSDGSVLTAMGSPDAVVFIARTAGSARLELVRGDPWHEPQQPATIDLDVLP